MKNYTILLALCSAMLNGYSQNKTSSSNYIITNSGDTINGSFSSELTYNGLFNVVFVDSTGVETTYREGELKGFCKDNVNYVSRVVFSTSGNSSRFLEVVVQGYVSLYSSEVLNDGGGLSSIVDYGEQYYLEREGSLIRVKNSVFAPSMRKYFSDDPEIVTKIKNRTYLYTHLPALVRAYNKNRVNASDF